MLAYFFPPLGGAGVQRSLKFVKYLPQFGWAPTVITTASTAYPARDASLLAEVPADVRVVRAWEPRGADLPARALSFAHLNALSRCAAWPDHAIAWAPAAFRAALRAVREDRPDVLWSTSAPHSSHLVARAVHRRTGIPWVADFRDEWADNPHLPQEPALVRRLTRRTERAITEAADRLVYAADYFDFAGADPARTSVIPNGVDEDDLIGVEPAARPDGVFRLTFVGTLYGERDARPVLDALARLVAAGAIDPERLELRIVGNNWLPEGRLAPEIHTSETGYVAHREALSEMLAASALLLYVPPDSLAPSGKLFEYLASERPILCVAREDNRAVQIVRELDAGVSAPSGDPAAIEAAVLELWRRWESGAGWDGAAVRAAALARFSRRRLAEQLAGVLDSAVSGA